MKKVLVLLTLVAAVSAYSQGTVNFFTRNTAVDPVISAPISYDGTGPVSAQRANAALSVVSGGFTFGPNAQAGLYGGAAGTPEANLVLLVPAVGFQTRTLGSASAGFIEPGTDASRVVAGVAPGALADFQVRAWDAGVAGVASYEAAAALAAQRGAYLGKSAILHNITLGGGGTPPGPPAELSGLAGFSMTYVPEPSIIGLGILGAIAGLMVFRRRS